MSYVPILKRRSRRRTNLVRATLFFVACAALLALFIAAPFIHHPE